MTLDIWLMMVVFIVTIIGLIMFPDKAPKVFGSALLATFLLGFVNEVELVGSITNQGVLSLVLLLLASNAVEKTSVIRWLSGKVDSNKFSFAWLKLYFFTAFSSAFLNNTAIVATLLSPIRNNRNLPGGKLLIVLSYAAILGGTLTLVGTSTNLLVNSMLLETGHPGFSFFSFSLIGLIVTLVCAVVIYFVSKKVSANFTAAEDAESYLLNAKVRADSSLVGKRVKDANLRHLDSLFLVEIVREGRVIRPVTPEHLIRQSDRLVFCGDVKEVGQLKQFSGLELMPEEEELTTRQLTEVVVRQNSALVGKTLKQSDFRAKFNAAVIAIKRDGVSLAGKLGDVKIQLGDFLVLATGDDFKNRGNLKKNFIIVSGVEPNHKLVGRKQLVPVLGFAAAMIAAATGVISLFKALVLLLAVNMLTRSIQIQDIRQRFPFEIWLIVSSALVMAHGLDNAGVVTAIANFSSFEITAENSFMFAIGLFLITLVLTELITNNAAAALMFPFAYSLPMVFQFDPIPFVIAVIFGANASFISPFSYQTNLMVFNAGQYRLEQFVKAGLPVSLAYSVTVLVCLKVMYFS